jgi:hypothetical protein
MSNGWVGFAVSLGLRGEVLINVVHSGNDSSEIRRSSREELSPILKDLGGSSVDMGGGGWCINGAMG